MGAVGNYRAHTFLGKTMATAKKEVDPSGLDQHSVGAKLDSGKIDMSLLLLFHRSLTKVAEVADFGQRKYTRGGFLEVENGEIRYTAALLRHLMTSEDVDGDSGLLHDAHAAWNALARLELRLKKEDCKNEWNKIKTFT